MKGGSQSKQALTTPSLITCHAPHPDWLLIRRQHSSVTSPAAPAAPCLTHALLSLWSEPSHALRLSPRITFPSKLYLPLPGEFPFRGTFLIGVLSPCIYSTLISVFIFVSPLLYSELPKVKEFVFFIFKSLVPSIAPTCLLNQVLSIHLKSLGGYLGPNASDGFVAVPEHLQG